MHDHGQDDFPADLQAKIEGTTITFSGKVSGEFYGVFTNVSPGGAEPTYGAFAGLNKGDEMEDAPMRSQPQ